MGNNAFFLEETLKRIKLVRARSIDILYKLKVEYDSPEEGCLYVSKNLGERKGISIVAKTQLDVYCPSFELNLSGTKIPFDVKICDARSDFCEPRHYFFSREEDIGLVEEFRTHMICGYVSRFYSNGRKVESNCLVKSQFLFGRFDTSDYFGDYKPLIKSIELKLGRKIIDINKIR